MTIQFMMGQPTSQLASPCNLIVSLATKLWQSTEEVQMASVNLSLPNQLYEGLWEGTISCVSKCMYLKDVYCVTAVRRRMKPSDCTIRKLWGGVRGIFNPTELLHHW